MKKLFFSFCLVLTAACLAPAIAAPFVSPHGYTMTVPADWHIKSPSMPGDDVDVVINQQVAVEHQMATPIFRILFRPVNYPVTSASLEGINRGVLSAARQSFPDLKVMSQTFSALNGVRDIDCIFTATANGLPLRFHEVLVIKNKKAFTFISICPNQVYPRYAVAYAQMLGSVRWKA